MTIGELRRVFNDFSDDMEVMAGHLEIAKVTEIPWTEARKEVGYLNLEIYEP